ncbi:outer membrane protein transport protein [uncultured Campylobacter sp.]|uniref:OmpP1/FadL family transporter n=1 Tax=uncultured Campylobacter sp. TaxID=218934 RepID=UPI00260989A0|nr:outer membrane protein transport protein [uncultured Campylobacter sp.]
MKKVLFSIVATCSLLNAGGYKVPEQSADSLGLAASNVAFSFGADAAYFNPANMMFLDGRHHVESTLGWFHINSLDFKTDSGKTYSSKKFDSLAGTFSFVTPELYENWKFGLALAVPAAVGISWEDPETAFTGKRFKLQVVELNPTVAYRINDKLAVAVGARGVYTKGKIASDFGVGYREIQGDAINYGYNVALTYRPIEELSFAVTYRSKVNLELKGSTDADFKGPLAPISYHGKTRVEIPLPAQLVLATGYKFSDFTLLLAYERTYWSKFKDYDFEFGDKTAVHTNPPFGRAFKLLMDDPVVKNAKDSNTYRIGLAYDVNEKLRLMAGFSYDEDITSSNHTGLELPNTTSKAYTAGLNYKFTDNLEVAFGYVYQHRDKKRATDIATGAGKMSGEFDSGKIQIVGTTFKYTF